MDFDTRLNPSLNHPFSRTIRVFVSSTFRDMVEDRNMLMTHTWPQLRLFCEERQVELVEVDLRWGIPEEQSARTETLKLCLDEIRACRPYFICMLGERYGWVPGDDAFTADLLEEQQWLRQHRDRSITELEIIYGVLREKQMQGLAFFYFRDPGYINSIPSVYRGDFTSEDSESKQKLRDLKRKIKEASEKNICHLRENYLDPQALSQLVLEDLKTVTDTEFPVASIPDPMNREALKHAAFSEIHRRTYVVRQGYFEALDRHALTDGGPFVLLGDSGSGKSALLANWIAHWRNNHPKDFIFESYIGSIPNSSEHWQLINRLIANIKQWSGDLEELPHTHNEIRKTFPAWLAKARNKAGQDGVRVIIVLDALDKLDDNDHARLLGWLPAHSFTGPLRLIVSTLPGDTLEAVKERGWPVIPITPLTPVERRKMIVKYLSRFGKKLNSSLIFTRYCRHTKKFVYYPKSMEVCHVP